jgi:hypothetical protein
MKTTIAWWDLSGSSQTIETLNAYLADEGVAPWSGIDGLLLKFWMSDATSNRWGAVMVWSDTADRAAPLPPNRATELIGYPPTERLSADLQAIVGDIESLARKRSDLSDQPMAAIS